MADFRLPGPVDGSRQRSILDDGTLMRRASAPPGSLRGGTATQADEFDPWALLRRAACVKEAAERARGRVPAVVLRETGEAIEALIEGLLPGLLMMMAVLGVSVGIGGAAGAAIGALAGGVGALPGAAIGAKAGASVGIWLLTWLGLGFLAVEIGRGLVELGGRCLDAVRIAWDAHGQSDREARIDRAADGLAEAVALLIKLILMAIVARLTMSQAGAAGRSAASSVDEMVTALRQSRLGAGFADWVAANAARLTRNPKLQMHRQVQGTQAVNEASTPSQLRRNETPEPEPAPAVKSELPPLRQAYVDEVSELRKLAEQMKAESVDEERIARVLHARRRELGEKYKALTPPDKLAEIYARNLERYGDKLGPSVDWLRQKGKTWEQIIESASRTGGKDLGF